MAHTVSYTEKNGKPGSAQFPTLALATMYARTVKGGKVLEGGCDADKSVAVIKCAAPEVVDAQRKAELAHSMIEREAEAYMEAGVETMLLGGSSSEALDNAVHAARSVSNICACGKSCGKNSICYSCRRYR